MKPELHLLPNNNIGDVYIIFNQKTGTQKVYSGKRRTYKIPHNGLLLSKFDINTGWIINDSTIKLYYVDENYHPIKELQYISISNPIAEHSSELIVATQLQYQSISFDSFELTICKYRVDSLHKITSTSNSQIDIELLRAALQN